MNEMKILRIAILSFCISISFSPIAPSFGQQNMKKSNWMYEYVQLRTYAKTRRAIGLARSGKLPVPITIKVVGGVPAGASDNPFQVALLKNDQADNFVAQFCGGTLIKPNIVVTAAHCSDFITADKVQVLTGTRKLDGSGVRRDVSRITIHPKWNAQTFDNDAAVWKLSSNATGITLASLATGDGSVGAKLLATGWGALQQGGGFPKVLYKVAVPLVGSTNCNDSNSYSGSVKASMLCAGLDAGGKDTCQGDSGGPLTRGANNNVLTGVTSWGRGCAQPNLFGVYARVSHPAIRNFIESND